MAEELAKGDPAFGVSYAAAAFGALPLLLGGTEAQRSRWLPALGRGEALAAFSLSEKHAGSDAGAVTSTAGRIGEVYEIRGEKKWVTHGGLADLYTVFCVTDPASRTRRLSAFLVDGASAGLTVAKVEETLGIRSVPVAELRFDGVRVPEENLLGGREGQGYRLAMAVLDRARPFAAAQAVGAAQGALDLALVYACRRRQFGAPIARLQMIQKILADLEIKIEAARWLTYAAAVRADASCPSARRSAAAAKCFATDVALEAATDAVQIFGGYGYMEDYPVAKLFRDAKILQIYEGTNQIQRLAVAADLVKRVEDLAHLEPFIPRENQGRSFGESVTSEPQGNTTLPSASNIPSR